MKVNRLVVTIEATHQSLEQRLEAATHPVTLSRPRDRYARTDAFMAATSRHLAAVDEVLLDVATGRLTGGEERVAAYMHQARLLELAIAHLKARLYGEVHAAHEPWSTVWDGVRRELAAHNELERAIVGDLAVVLDDARCDALAEKVYRAEVKAPTRSHPYIPHRGLIGHVARRVWAIADRFWDTAESRAVPQPVRPHPKEHSDDSLMAQYVMGEPLLDDKAPLFAHHPGQHRRHLARHRAPKDDVDHD
jgi:hypothetical protein